MLSNKWSHHFFCRVVIPVYSLRNSRYSTCKSTRSRVWSNKRGLPALFICDARKLKTWTNCSRKVCEIECGSWQSWLGWRGWQMIICERPAPPDDNLQETGWRDKRRRRRKRRRKKRRRKEILAHGPNKGTRGPRGPKKKRDKKVGLAYLDPVAGGPMVAVAYFAPSDFFLSNHQKKMLQNNRMNTLPFKNSAQNNFWPKKLWNILDI